MIKRMLRGGIRRLGLDITRYRRGVGAYFTADFTAQEQELCEIVRPFTQTSPERIQAVASAVRYLEKYQIDGAMVECGVWKGGSCMAMAHTLMAMGNHARDLYLFDTFEGMSAATDVDIDHAGNPAQKYYDWFPNFNVVPLDEVRSNMSLTGYPSERIHYIQGKVEQTLPSKAPDEIALLRLDTDWYESTRHELIHLYPRVVPHGIVIIDDYGHFKGVQKAVDQFLDQLGQPVFLSRIDYTGRIFVKPAESRLPG